MSRCWSESRASPAPLRVEGPGELDRPRLTIVGDEELVIGRLCALLDRCAARDVWDVANLRARAAAAPDLPTFRWCFLALAGTLDHSPDTYTERRLAERTTQREVDEQLVPMLATGARARAAELVAAAWSRLAPLLVLTEAERGFVERLHRGDLDASPLFPDDAEEAARIAAHPALRWKAQNARSHHDRR